MDVDAGWIDQWTWGEDESEPRLMVEVWSLTLLYRPETAWALQWVLLGFGFWVRVDWN